MRAVAGKAVFFNSRVLKEERAALVRVATPALCLNRLLFHHSVALRAVRIVAARAGHLSLDNGVVGRFVDLHPGLFVATDTGFVFEPALGKYQGADSGIAFGDRYGGSARGFRVHRVAIIAAHIIATVPARFPEREVPVAGMTTHAGTRLFLSGDGSFAKAHRESIFRRIVHMRRFHSVA